MKSSMNDVKTKVRVPICGAVVYASVVTDARAERESQFFVDLFGKPPESDYYALCAYDGKGTFGLFFAKQKADADTIAHEIFHLTHRILDWRYGGCDEKLHEFAADLCGWLTQWLWDEIKILAPVLLIPDETTGDELQTLLSELSEQDRYPDWSPVATKLYDAIYGE